MPLDTRIALGVQPLQVQFRDPIASYNQLAQLQSNDTQNQLAQMQMQEARQLAPYRMQEQQYRAAAAKLTLDEANEAQTYIKTVMTKAAEASGGTATTNPFEAAKQMMGHPNSQVQAAGLRLLESSQKLQAYEQQSQFLKDEGGAAVVPTPIGAPAVVAPSVSNVAAPMVAPGTPAPNVASALSRFVAGTKDMPDGRVGPYFSIGGQPVSEEQYLSGREAIMLPQSANALAPAVAAAPAVNAMIPAVASALQNADALKKEIEKGDRTYGQAPGWKSKRELLVKAYEQALKPGAVVTKSEFERLLDESGLTDTEKQAMRKAKLAKETAKPSDRPEPKSEFEKLLAESGLTEDEKQAMRKAKLTKETTVPTAQAERKTDFEKLLEDSGLSEDEKQAMRKAKLTKETSPSAAADSQFEQTMTALGLSDDKKNALRRQLLAKELRVPSENGAGGKGRPPIGYRYDASGENLEVIPGGPADKPKELRPIPANINTAISTNDMSIKRIQEALDLLKKNPDAIGLKNLLPGQALDRADPKGVAVRSAIGDIGSLVIHERSGAAVSGSEMQRLGFIPTPTDRADNAKTKLEAMLKYAKMNQQALIETYAEDQGYKPNPTLSRKGAAPAGDVDKKNPLLK